MSAPPPLSVVMPVHDALPYLDESMASILGQSYGDFELVVHDDGSTDGSSDALRDWAARDSRVRLTHGPRLGPVGSSNLVVKSARAPLVARMDADDVAVPERLARQMEVMGAAPDVIAVGTLYETIDASGRVRRPTDPGRLGRSSAFAPFPHPSLMMRRAAFDAAGGYREACMFWEDVDLYLRLAREGRIAVVAEPLVRVRHTTTSTRRRDDDVELAYHRMYSCLRDWTSRSADEVLPRGPSARLDPRVFVALGSIDLWAGERPRTLARVLGRAHLRADVNSVMALGWSAWAFASPRTLRGCLRLRNRLRARSGEHPVYEWSPGWPARALV
jgi:glycosyltransferase involved in cell wall biosynthesis